MNVTQFVCECFCLGHKELHDYSDKKHSYGQHETFVASDKEGEALNKRKEPCKKNPGHPKYIPVETFSKEHLPKRYRDPDLYELVKSIADLTVRVEVKVTSPKRPKFWPGTDVAYPFSESTGDQSLRMGSGQMSVFKLIDGCGYDALGVQYNALGAKYERRYKTCPCKNCLVSENPSRVWWEIIVLTAAHVVYDETEASATSCRLFYDKEDSPLVRLETMSIEYVNIDRDFCGLKYATCDATLGNRLYALMEHRFEIGKRIWQKYKGRSLGKFIFIVSHPHGCTKQVSFGKWVKKSKINHYNSDYNYTKLTYNTCTCPGSSGAVVHCVGFFGANHVHSGVYKDRINYSSVGYCRKQ
uniref:Peptidase S1 domain-containing protein n=1 Tax=Biomphalaria glabrata TaxID=6526 RepID=A0A2C9LKT1_BIOGL